MENDLYKVEHIKEHEKFKLLIHVDRKKGKLYIRIVECNVGKTSWGAPQHHVFPSLSVFHFPPDVGP